MTETIEQKALELVNAVRIERGFPPSDSIEFDDSHWDTAFYRAIEAHEADNARHAAEMEAFRREVSEAVKNYYGDYPRDRMHPTLSRFIIAQPDPIAEAWIEATGNTVGMEPLNAALAARGLEIVKKEPSQ